MDGRNQRQKRWREEEKTFKDISVIVFLRKLAITNLKILTYTHYSVYDAIIITLPRADFAKEHLQIATPIMRNMSIYVLQ